MAPSCPIFAEVVYYSLTSISVGDDLKLDLGIDHVGSENSLKDRGYMRRRCLVARCTILDLVDAWRRKNRRATWEGVPGGMGERRASTPIVEKLCWVGEDNTLRDGTCTIVGEVGFDQGEERSVVDRRPGNMAVGRNGEVTRRGWNDEEDI